MELDDLRRQWQQPAPADAPAPLNTSALALLLARGSRSPVSRMRRNAWVEIGFGLSCFLGGCLALLYINDAYSRTMLAWLLIVCLLSCFYLRRKLALLRGLDDASGALREHMARQLISIRGLMRLYHQLTGWSLVVSLGIGMFFQASSIHKLVSHDWPKALGTLTAYYVVAGIGTFFLMRSLTRWHLQRLYGQHLDCLEASLRELGDEPTG